MQKHQVAGEAGSRTPSWYLRRGDKRYGPLGDRELLLLVERGGLRTDDLLWKPGFSSWKSGDAPSQAEIARALGVSEPRKTSLRAKLYEELRKLLMIFAYLWLVFFVFL